MKRTLSSVDGPAAAQASGSDDGPVSCTAEEEEEEESQSQSQQQQQNSVVVAGAGVPMVRSDSTDQMSGSTEKPFAHRDATNGGGSSSSKKMESSSSRSQAAPNVVEVQLGNGGGLLQRPTKRKKDCSSSTSTSTTTLGGGHSDGDQHRQRERERSSPVACVFHPLSPGHQLSQTRLSLQQPGNNNNSSSSCSRPSAAVPSSLEQKQDQQHQHQQQPQQLQCTSYSVTDLRSQQQNGVVIDNFKQQQQQQQKDGSSQTHSNNRAGTGTGAAAAVVDVAAQRAQVRAWGNQPLSAVDPDLWDIMEREKVRQWRGIELIASENFASQAVIEALGSHLTNKYSEGLPGSRYYGGNEHIDKIEFLCISRALAAFHLDPKEWGVNVQPYSCTSANFAVFTALLQPKDRIMGLDVPSGGHVSHGYYTASGKKVSGASIFFESLPFKVNPQTGLIDFETLEKFAMSYRPKILICGGSAYPREWDYARFRRIANKCGALLMCDMAHISGLIAAEECANPFEHVDIVTSTTHKSLRGPRGGLIFFRKGPKPRRSRNAPECFYDFEDRINFAVHPSLQGGPHNNHIAALAVALKQVDSPEYQQYIRQVKKNARALAAALVKRGCVLVTGGTDNHLLLWDLRNRGLTGNRLEKVCEMCHMTLNKNAVFGDSSALGVGGVRIGTPAMTSRGCIESDFEAIADLLMAAVQIAENIQREHGKLQEDFVKGLQRNKEIAKLRERVEKFATTFQMPGFEVEDLFR